MKSKYTDIQALMGHNQEWPRVGVYFDQRHEALVEHLLDHAERMHLRLLDLKNFHGYAHPVEQIRAALIDGELSHDHMEKLRNQGIPIVCIKGATPTNDDPDLPTVFYYREACGKLAAEYFADRDFKHVAFIGRDPWGRQRALYDLFATHARRLGMTVHLRQFAAREDALSHLPEPERWAVRQRLFEDWLHTLPKPVGLLARNDLEASRYIQWVLGGGQRVPEDVAVLGIGNSRMVCESALVPISSIVFDVEQLATGALDCVKQIIAGISDDPTSVPVLPAGVVTRRSTDVLAASDPSVVKALCFMCTHINIDLSVDQIAGHVGVGRRTLERAFRRELHRGIRQEFQRRRLEKIRELLTQTDLTVAQIADVMQFSSSSRLCRVFRSVYDMSPVRYRREAGVGD